MRRGSERFWAKLSETVGKETGFDLEDANVKVGELAGRVREGVGKGRDNLERLRTDLVPAFLNWNRWERWKVIYQLTLSPFSFLFLFSLLCLRNSSKTIENMDRSKRGGGGHGIFLACNLYD